MKKTFAIALTLLLTLVLLAGCFHSSAQAPGNAAAQEQASATPVGETAGPGRDIDGGTNAPPYTIRSIPLDVGQFAVYDFGELKLHAYETNDPLANESYFLETGDGLIAIELAPFYSNIEEIQAYLSGLGKPLAAVIVAYHPAGADQFSGTRMVASEGLGEQALVAGFVEAFGDLFNGNLPTEFELIESGTVTISGVEFNVIETDDAFDLEIPAINSYFTHMLGASTHNILASVAQIDAMLSQMQQFQVKDYSLILTGHDLPRTIEIAAEKIDYLERTKVILAGSETAEEFTAAMLEAFPGYHGENYLEMSAGALYA